MLSCDSLIKNKRTISFLVNEKNFIDFILNNNPSDYFAFDKSYVQDYLPKGKVCLAKYYNYKQVKKNNAEVLFLNSTAAAAIRRYSFIGRVKYFLLPINLTLFLIPVLMGLARYATRSQYKYCGIFKSENTKLRYKYWLAFKPQRKKFSLGALRFYSPLIPKEVFFKKLKNVKYCLLRWHERLDSINKDEDLDMLVDTHDIDKFMDVINENIGTLPIALHSVAGNYKLSKSKISYYPPDLAEKILQNVVTGPKNVKIPTPEYALLSFIYHLLFHKGYKSGLKTKFSKNMPTEKYTNYLKVKARDAGIDIPETMEGLSEYLKSKNWLPPNDMIHKYALSNEWVRDYFISGKYNKIPAGLAVFLVRELASHKHIIDEIINTLTENGFLILKSEKIDKNKLEYVAKNIRGGNWSENMASEISGLPFWLIITFDSNPIKHDKKSTSNPFLDNKRTEIKSDIRKMANKYFPQYQRTSIIHSSDNSQEALDYIEVLLSGDEKKHYLDYLLSQTKLYTNSIK